LYPLWKRTSKYYGKMGTKNDIPIQFRNTFKSFEEYKEWCLEKSKKDLMKAFEKVENNGNTDWKKKIETN